MEDYYNNQNKYSYHIIKNPTKIFQLCKSK